MHNNDKDEKQASIRASFDVRSGATKLSVAKMNGNAIEELIFQEQTPVLYGHDHKKRKDGTLSEAILQEGYTVLENYVKLAQSLGASHFAGVATATFRETLNGPAFLERVKQSLGLSLALVSQEEEAILGFLTCAAVAPTNVPQENIVALDSGASSFQLTRCIQAEPPKYEIYSGSLGSSKVTCLLVD